MSDTPAGDIRSLETRTRLLFHLSRNHGWALNDAQLDEIIRVVNPEPKWRKELPDKTGWWWVRDISEMYPQLFQAHPNNRVSVPVGDHWLMLGPDDYLNTEFLGPIPTPT